MLVSFCVFFMIHFSGVWGVYVIWLRVCVWGKAVDFFFFFFWISVNGLLRREETRHYSNMFCGLRESSMRGKARKTSWSSSNSVCGWHELFGQDVSLFVCRSMILCSIMNWICMLQVLGWLKRKNQREYNNKFNLSEKTCLSIKKCDCFLRC